MQNYTEIKHCRCCKKSTLIKLLDLGKQPLANSYHKNQKLNEYPLSLNLCTSCFHLQLSIAVNPESMFKNYLYVTGTSKTLNKYCEEFVSIASKYTKGTVLDIACNDGTQLDKFSEKGWKTFGVDPAENLHKISSKKHKVLCDFWGTELLKKQKLNNGNPFNLIVAQNVFAHVNDTDDFLKACEKCMDNDSFLMIQTSQADMVLKNEFDTTYHEHLSYFNTNSMNTVAKRNGFSIVDVFKTDIHGNSYVFVLKKGDIESDKLQRQLELEKNQGLFSLETYINFSRTSRNIASKLKKEISKLADDGFKVVGYGAAAKGNTLLNFAKIKLDYIVDDNPMKWGFLTPGMNIPIYSVDKLKEEDCKKIAIVVLAWNFFKEIRNKVTIKFNGENPAFYIKYFPEVEKMIP